MIVIEDNFLSDLEHIKKEASGVKLYSPLETDYWQGFRSRDLEDQYPDLYNMCLNTFHEKFSFLGLEKYKPCIYLHARADSTVHVHVDKSAVYSGIVFFDGQDLDLWSGTGMFTQVGQDFHLDTLIGYKENRAIVFNADILHSCMKPMAKNKDLRYTFQVFFYEK